MSQDTWTEVTRRVGNNPDWHYEVGPDADHLNIEIRYREMKDGKFETGQILTVDPDLVPLLADALKKAVKELDPG